MKKINVVFLFAILLCVASPVSGICGQKASHTTHAAFKGIDSLSLKKQREAHIVSQLKTVFDKTRILRKSDQFASVATQPRRDITLLLREAGQNIESYSEENKAYIRMLLMRPESTSNKWPWNSGTSFYLPDPVLTYDSPGGKFKFWYVTHSTADSGGHIHTTEASFVQEMALVFDAVYTQEITTMGYPESPDDSGISQNGGDSRMDVYVMNCGFYSIYGYAIGEGSTASLSSFMVMDNAFTEFASHSQTAEEAMKVTAAHEYFHTVQFGIGFTFNSNEWIMEAGATWMEDQVYDDIDDNHQYLNGYTNGFFNNPHISLNSANDLYWYNSWIWFEYMETKWGQSAVQSVWNDYIGLSGNGLSAVASVLSDNSSTFQEAFTEFSTWNYIQTETGETTLYKDASLYNEVKIDNATSLIGYNLDYRSASSDTFAEQTLSLNHIATRYFKLTPGATISDDQNDTLSVFIQGAEGRDIEVVPVVKSDTTYTLQSLSLDESNYGTLEIENFNRDAIDEVVLVVVNYSSSQNETSVIISGGLGTDGAANKPGTNTDSPDTDPSPDPVTPTPVSTDSNTGGGCFINLLN